MVATLFLDLDGVLVDFVGGALSHHGAHIPYDEVRWDMASQLGVSDFWSGMQFDFWANLDWTPDGREILEGVEDIFEDIVILTSPIDVPGAVEGKIEWIRRNMPAYTRRFFVGPPKDAIAGPGKFLLDDYDLNVQRWRAAGGVGVLVPRPWNSGEGDPIDFLSWAKGNL